MVVISIDLINEEILNLMKHYSDLKFKANNYYRYIVTIKSSDILYAVHLSNKVGVIEVYCPDEFLNIYYLNKLNFLL